MKNQPGISWASDSPVNLIKEEEFWLAVYFYEDGSFEIIKKYKKPDNLPEELAILSEVKRMNYGVCELCPMVKAAMDDTP